MSTRELIDQAAVNSFPGNDFESDRVGRPDRRTSNNQESLAASRRRCFEEMVNLEELLERVDNDRELLREIFGLLLAEYSPLREELRAAVNDGNMQRIQTTTHTLRGMLANLAVASGIAAAEQIEQRAQTGDQAGIEYALAQLEAVMDRLIPSIEAFLADTEE